MSNGSRLKDVSPVGGTGRSSARKWPRFRVQDGAALRAGAAALIPWPAPVAPLVLALGQDTVFAEIALFFSKKAVVTFGGTGAIPGYVAQVAVGTCLRLGGTLDGLGASETTPGPLMMVLQFAGFLGAFHEAGWEDARLAGGLLTTWVTFAPCCAFIFLGVRFMVRLRANRPPSAHLTAAPASVVILNLAILFAIHAVWRKVLRIEAGPLCRRSFPFAVPSTDGSRALRARLLPYSGGCSG